MLQLWEERGGAGVGVGGENLAETAKDTLTPAVSPQRWTDATSAAAAAHGEGVDRRVS